MHGWSTFKTNDELDRELAKAGVPLARVVVAIDCTASNGDLQTGLHKPGGDGDLNE